MPRILQLATNTEPHHTINPVTWSETFEFPRVYENDDYIKFSISDLERWLQEEPRTERQKDIVAIMKHDAGNSDVITYNLIPINV